MLQIYFDQIVSQRVKLKWDELYAVENWESEELDSPFSEEEIKKALFDMAGDKSPGPYGFPGVSYQELWDMLKVNVMCMFDEL